MSIAMYLTASAIPALFAGKGAASRMGGNWMAAFVGVVFYAAIIGSLYALGKFDG
ncbi:hypothetical protein [Duganella vulcania]|uniref:Uncharacterized protein n=1 Tax=Duganella vulcania TaxID=2692166 RepID=A0A845GHB7_9BURK|nr:hypothetical protein [Duganella vulcania]MYM92408.1 hypothetical protein [Duganella vulcania]